MIGAVDVGGTKIGKQRGRCGRELTVNISCAWNSLIQGFLQRFERVPDTVV